MTDDLQPPVLRPEDIRLRKNSRLTAIITLVSGVMVLAALGAGASQVAGLEKRKRDLSEDIGKLDASVKSLQATRRALLDDLERASGFAAQGDLAATRQALPPVVSPASAAVSPAEVRRVSVPRIYFQIRTGSQVGQYEACKTELSKAGARVPQYERLDVGPRRTELRYFSAGEETKARELQQILEACLGEPVALSRPPHTNVNPLHFEVWLAPASS